MFARNCWRRINYWFNMTRTTLSNHDKDIHDKSYPNFKNTGERVVDYSIF